MNSFENKVEKYQSNAVDTKEGPKEDNVVGELDDDLDGTIVGKEEGLIDEICEPKS